MTGIYQSENDYLSWAIDVIVKWKKSVVNKDVIHIHGKSDTVFSIKNIIHHIEIPGDHAIILTQYNWFNKNLPNIIQ